MSLYWEKQDDIKEVASILNQDKVLLATSDTVLGLLAPLSQTGYDLLNKIKQREKMPYLVLIGSKSKLDYFIDQELSPKVRQFIEMSWPGPVTFIFKARAALPDYLKSAQGTIALRLPDHKGLQFLLQEYNGLFSTSANMHKEPIPKTVSEVNSAILQHVGGICLDEQNHQDEPIPSSIIDCSDQDIKVIRAGAKMRELLNFLEK